MTTDLDTRLTQALRDAASTTSVSDDAFARIMDRATRRSLRQSPRRTMTTAAVVLAVAAGAGAAYAVVVDRLDSDQAEVLEQMMPSCGIETERAQLVASFTGLGRTVDYWIVDSDNTFGDFVFLRGSIDGSGGCGATSRATAHPHLPWVQYSFSPLDDATNEYWFYGQAPVGTAEVDIVMSSGSVRTSVTSDDGYFVVLAELPSDAFERIDAYSDDGTLIASGGIS